MSGFVSFFTCAHLLIRGPNQHKTNLKKCNFLRVPFRATWIVHTVVAKSDIAARSSNSPRHHFLHMPRSQCSVEAFLPDIAGTAAFWNASILDSSVRVVMLSHGSVSDATGSCPNEPSIRTDWSQEYNFTRRAVHRHPTDVTTASVLAYDPRMKTFRT